MKRLHLLALDLLLRCAITQSNLVLFRFHANDFEFVFLAGGEQRSCTVLARRLLPITFAFRPPLLNFRNVAKRLDAIREFDKRPEISRAYYFALDDVIHLVSRKEIRPDVVHLLQPKREPAIFGVDLQHFRLHRVALLKFLARMLHALGPTDVADVNEALEPFIHFDERPEIGKAAHAAADHRADRETLGRGLPWIGQRLLQAERNSLRVRLHFENHHFHVVADFYNLRRVLHAPRPTHLADVNQSFHSRLNLHKGAVIRHPDNFRLNARARWKSLRDSRPRIGKKLLAAERNARLFLVELENLDFDLVIHLDDFIGMLHAPPSEVGDVQQSIQSAKIDKHAVVGDILHAASDGRAFHE